MFYPRVQTPQPVSNFRTFTNTLTGTGQGINADLRSRRIEPGQRECIALMVTPNFIPSVKVSTVANWFDVTGHHARNQLDNREMLKFSRKIQQAKAAVARACNTQQYRAVDFIVLNQRIKQLEALLPTQDTRIDLPDEGDLLGSEIFSSNAAGLNPTLLSWYGEPVQDGTVGAIFLQGRGFSVSETQVIVGGVPLPPTAFRLISRNVMQILVPPTARSVKVACPHDAATPATPADPKVASVTIQDPRIPRVYAQGGVAEVQVDANKARANLDPTLTGDVDITITDGTTTATARGAKADLQVGGVRAHGEGSPVTPPKTCDRAVIDVHVATPNGISNHLFVEVIPKTAAKDPKNAVTTATTTTVVQGNTTTTSTRFETTPPGTVLPPLTVLPLGTNWPSATVLAPGAVTGAPAGSLLPGLVPASPTPAASTLSLNPPAAAATTPTTTPAAITPPPTPTPPPGGLTARSGRPGPGDDPVPIERGLPVPIPDDRPLGRRSLFRRGPHDSAGPAPSRHLFGRRSRLRPAVAVDPGRSLAATAPRGVVPTDPGLADDREARRHDRRREPSRPRRRTQGPTAAAQADRSARSMNGPARRAGMFRSRRAAGSVAC